MAMRHDVRVPLLLDAIKGSGAGSEAQQDNEKRADHSCDSPWAARMGLMEAV
jgi:hypothetical protein